MSSPSGWYFTEEQLSNSPSRRCGMTAEQELAHRQRAANLIQEMGQRLQVSQLCINTGIVYMHRFYAFHSFTMFHRNGIAAAAFFLAAKVEEQPRKLDHVIKILNICLEKNDVNREMMPELTAELVFHENILLQTLGFDVAIDHPHTHVVRACQLFNIVTVSRELRQTCYFMASNSLHLTTMCLKYRPTVVAAFCIYIACKWSRWDIPDSSEGKPWYSYVDDTVTLDTLKKLTDEYLQILDRSPSKFKNKMKSITNGQGNCSSRDDASTSGQSKHDTKHHHPHHRSSSSNNRKPDVSASKQSQIVMPLPVPSSSYNKNQFSQPTSSSSQRQSSSSTSSTTSSSTSRPAYPTSESNIINSQKDAERMQRHLESSSAYQSMSRQIDPMKMPRMSSSHTATSSSSLSQQQQPPSHVKSSSLEQRHSMSSSKTPIDFQQQNKKPSSTVDYQNRSSSSSLAPPTHPHPQQQQQQQQNLLAHKKSSWPSQQQPQSKPTQALHSSQSSSSSHSQQNLNTSQSSSSSNNVHRANSTQHLPPSYIDQSSKSHQQQQQQQQQQSMMSNSVNDFWFSDITQSQPIKNATPVKQEVVKKSIFSPSPNHEPAGSDKTQMMMMSSSNIKREISPKSEKYDRKSSTPVKKEKRSMDGSMMSKSSSSQDKKHLSGLQSSSSSSLMSDTKKRPFNTVDNDNHDNRDTKMRKLEMKQVDIPLGINKSQPIETNPDAVKSLLQECIKANSNKFDFNGDSPLDVTTPDLQVATLPSPLISTLPNHMQIQKPTLVDHLPMKVEPIDNGMIDEMALHKKHAKSKKKKDKHKKKKKSHKSDREDSEREAAPLKIILAKDKSDSKSSPESLHTTGSLKIKIPINKTDFGNNQPPVTAPLKLKISKDKIGGFNNSFADGGSGGGGTSSSSSSSHKKKDKEKDKHRKSKHNNNNSDGYSMLHQQQQYSGIGKMDTNQMLMQPQSSMQFPPVDLQQQLLMNPQLMHMPQQHQHHQNYLFQNPSNC